MQLLFFFARSVGVDTKTDEPTLFGPRPEESFMSTIKQKNMPAVGDTIEFEMQGRGVKGTVEKLLPDRRAVLKKPDGSRILMRFSKRGKAKPESNEDGEVAWQGDGRIEDLPASLEVGDFINIEIAVDEDDEVGADWESYIVIGIVTELHPDGTSKIKVVGADEVTMRRFLERFSEYASALLKLDSSLSDETHGD